MKKRVISLLLCLLMALSLIPTAAFASDVATQGGHKPGEDPKPPQDTTFYASHIDVDFDGTVNIGNQVVKVKITSLSAVVDGTTYADFTEQHDNQWRRSFSGDAKPTYDSTVTIRCTLVEVGGTRTWDFEKTYTRDELVYARVNYCPDSTGFDFNITKDVQEQINTNGTLTIKKVLADGAPDAAKNLEFEFKIMQNGTQVGGIIKVKAGDTSAPVTLPEGDYTVEEVNGQIEGYNLSTTVNYGTPTSAASTQCNPPKKSVVEAGKNTEVTVTNSYEALPPTTNTLTIEKKVEGDVDASNITFNFTITNTNTGVVYPASITGAGTTDVTVPLGSYLVTEKQDDAQIPGYSLTVTGSGTTVDVTATTPGKVTVTNAYDKIYGDDIVNPASLTVFKKNARTDALLSGAEFQLLKKVGNDYVAVGTPAVTTSTGMIAFTDLEPGDYQLKETKAPANYVGWTDHVFAFAVVKNDEPTDAAHYNETTKQFEKVYDSHIVLSSDLEEGFKDFYKNYSFANNELTVYNEKIETVTIPVKKIVDAPYAPVGDTEFTFYVSLGYDNNTSVFEDVDLLSDFHVSFKAKDADNAVELTFDDVENRYSFTMNASSVKDGEGTLILTGTRNDLDRLAVSVWEDEDEAPENWVYADEPCVAILTYDKESNEYLLLNEDEESVTVPFTFTNKYTKIDSVTATVNIEKIVERERGSRKPGKADFTFEAYYTDADGKLVKIDQTLTISTNGVGKYDASWDLVVPAAAFDADGNAAVTIKEVNSKKSGWTYDKTEYELIVTLDGKVSLKAAADEVDPAAALTLEFTNKYYKRTSSPTPPDNKPVTSVKTGDMGIALYAVTSLLSLSGAALVIKKRKDEE